MATVWLALRADVRRRWRALVSLALLLGLAGGVVLTAAAGARRTDTAYPRLLSWANASQVEVTSRRARSGVLRRASPAAAGRGGGDGESVHRRAAGTARPARQPGGGARPAPDGTYGATVDRVKILAGRMFSPGAAGRGGDRPADSPAMDAPARPATRCTWLGDPVPADTPQGTGPQAAAFPLDLPGDGHRRSSTTRWCPSPRPTASHWSCSAPGSPAPPWLRALMFRRLDRLPGCRRGAAAARRGPGRVHRHRPGRWSSRYPARANGSFTAFVDLSAEITATERAIRPQAVALAIFAALAGVISLAVLGQLLARQLALDSAEFPILRAFGMTRRSLLALVRGPARPGHGRRRRSWRSRSRWPPRR